MGLLDNFNFDDPKTQGLLSAAANLLSASSNPYKPTDYGQGLAGFQQGYGNAIKAQQVAQELDYQNKLRQAQAAKMQEEADKMKAAQARQEKMMSDLANAGTNQNFDFKTSMQNPDVKPTLSPKETLINKANIYLNYGDAENAKRLFDAANSLDKKVKTFEKVNVNGSIKYAPLFEDGTSGKPVEYDVAEKLMQQDLGGTSVLRDPYTGKIVTQDKKTMTFGDQAAFGNLAVSRERLTFDKNNQYQPKFSAELGGFISLPSKQNPNGSFTPLAGLNKSGVKLTEDQGKATGWLVQATNAYKNMQETMPKKIVNGKEVIDYENAKPGINDAIAAIPSLGAGEALANSFRGADRQKFIQAASSFSEAVLRAATGAGVNKDEAAQKVRELTPVFGDSDAVIEQKMAAAQLYLESLKVRAGAGANAVDNIFKNTTQKSGGVRFLGFEE